MIRDNNTDDTLKVWQDLVHLLGRNWVNSLFLLSKVFMFEFFKKPIYWKTFSHMYWWHPESLAGFGPSSWEKLWKLCRHLTRPSGDPSSIPNSYHFLMKSKTELSDNLWTKCLHLPIFSESPWPSNNCCNYWNGCNKSRCCKSCSGCPT